MSESDKKKFTFEPFVSTVINENESSSQSSSTSTECVTLDSIILNISLKFTYTELEAFVDELMSPCEYLRSTDTEQCVSILHLYALESTREPIDMSNQSVRLTYRPNLFTRKNDAFGPWNFNFLLTLLELSYEYDGTDDKNLPKIWKTKPTTKVKINKMSQNTAQSATATTVSTNSEQQDDITLIGLLKAICRQNKCDESDVNIWLRALKGIAIIHITYSFWNCIDTTCFL